MGHDKDVAWLQRLILSFGGTQTNNSWKLDASKIDVTSQEFAYVLDSSALVIATDWDFLLTKHYMLRLNRSENELESIELIQTNSALVAFLLHAEWESPWTNDYRQLESSQPASTEGDTGQPTHTQPTHTQPTHGNDGSKP